MALGTMAMLGSTAHAQKVAFEEFDLEWSSCGFTSR